MKILNKVLLRVLFRLKQFILKSLIRYGVIIAVLGGSAIFLSLQLKVHPQGVPYYQVSRDRQIGGAFESSGSTSRYALVETIVTRGRMDFNTVEARFAAPDVAKVNDTFFSLFAPGISFLAIPFFLLGTITGHEQFFTYFLNVFFAVADGLLIILILKRFGYSLMFQILPALIFIFATNAFSYSLYLTQHIVSTFFVLLSLYITLFKPSLLTNIILGLTFGIGLLIDIPNAFLLLPSVIYALLKHFDFRKIKDVISFTFYYIVVGMLLGLIPFILLFGWYNKALTGSATTIAQFVGRAEVDSSERPDKAVAEKKQAELEEMSKYGQLSPFQTRFILNGLYILLISNERGWLYYSPILFIGIIGMYFVYRKQRSEEILFVPVTIVLLNILMYSMFADPWGGWSFGPRYMIPAASIMVLFIPVVLQKFKKNILVIVCILSLIAYGVFINTLGAITTTEIPPKQEAEHLSTHIPYTYEYNFQLLEKGESYSLIHTMILPMVNLKTIWLYESTVLTLCIISPILYYSGKEYYTQLRKK